MTPLTPVSSPIPASSPIRVLVVDDSAFMRKMVSEILARDPGICIAGQARDGADALVKLEALHPDVVTMDIEMPVLDGIGALAEIMRRRPTPVLMLSSLTQAGAEATLRCLELGAFDFVGKPSGSISLDIEKIGAELISKVKAAAGARFHAQSPASNMLAVQPRLEIAARKSTDKIAVLAIGASTGGPRALQQLIPMLPANLGVPIVIVQHMPPGFTASLAQRLEQMSPFVVREAVNGDRLKAGQILVAPGGHHLQFDAGGVARLTQEPPIHGVRPSVDVTLASLMHLYGSRLLAVLLTGMGKDGARAMKQIVEKGGLTLAEDETTCVVYGMPKAAFDLGGVSRQLPLPEIAPAIARACGVSS